MLAVLLGLVQTAPGTPVEFCPATLAIRSQGVSHSYQDQIPASQSYGFELTAEGARTIVNSTLAFETTGGWFTVNVPAATLTEKKRHYAKPYDRFVETEFASPVMYVQFPRRLQIDRVWVRSAAASGDGSFGWQSKGEVSCEPPPARDMHTYPMGVDEIDADPLGAPPKPGAAVLLPAASPALKTVSCSRPFDDIKTLIEPIPDNPPSGHYFGARWVLLKYAVNADGSIAGDWIIGSSRYPELDRAALAGPYRGAYQAGRAYCRAVPGTVEIYYDMERRYDVEAPVFNGL